ncbi:IclR family transcriptional regulator [Rhodococcus sp. 14-2483-1-1]|uniref:IclR family transcriptional regulator n=1 Tax=unclassified Rhodococcus (in: high G+C Gram-positive bacteria) TaxID=192944 RepID=UPI000B9B2E73|nr:MULTISPECIES: IclR family transcriptional regulator [unclassified Rhodococcus (in: high G+C Gram-positive bacteria)]OZC48902.1 IclR family transcriptional regulator [Rhodococcus sp. WWJCD1]OZF35889.1 IclR family transcriptional regulator [Rhodococcus sp. 14-2483-1-1]
MAGNVRDPGASVASRLLAVLSVFDEHAPALTLTELADGANLPIATAHRLVRELVDWGALVRSDDGRYVVGRRLWKLGLLAPDQSDLREIASPFLHDIYGATLATVHLAIRDGDEVLYLDRLAGHASVPAISRVGARLPLYSTGVGKVLLAYAPREVHDRVLRNLTRITPFTVTRPAQLENELRRVHREGYAQTVEEMTLGACSVAVPIRDGENVVASLGLVVPSIGRDRVRLVAALQVAAQGIGRSLRTG